MSVLVMPGPLAGTNAEETPADPGAPGAAAPVPRAEDLTEDPLFLLAVPEACPPWLAWVDPPAAAAAPLPPSAVNPPALGAFPCFARAVLCDVEPQPATRASESPTVNAVNHLLRMPPPFPDALIPPSTASWPAPARTRPNRWPSRTDADESLPAARAAGTPASRDK